MSLQSVLLVHFCPGLRAFSTLYAIRHLLGSLLIQRPCLAVMHGTYTTATLYEATLVRALCTCQDSSDSWVLSALLIDRAGSATARLMT